MVNNDMRLNGRRGRLATWGGGTQEEEGRRASAERALDAIGEAGSSEQREGGGGTPSATTQHGYVHARGGAATSTEEGADLQGFTPARAHLSLWEVNKNFPHQRT